MSLEPKNLNIPLEEKSTSIRLRFSDHFWFVASILLSIFSSWTLAQQVLRMLERPTLLGIAVCAGLAILLIGLFRYSVRIVWAMVPAALVFVLATVLGR